jgi:hypothetical protein
MHNRITALDLPVLSLALALAACGAPEAQDDAPGEVGEHAAALGTCFNNTCNGLDPAAAGCEADAYTVSTGAIGGYGTVAVRYSPGCSAAWARVSSNAPYYLSAQITRSSPFYTTQAASPTATYSLRSRMVGVSAGKTVTATGRLGTAPSYLLYQGQATKTF